MLKIKEKIIFGHDPKLFIWNGKEMEESCTNLKQSGKWSLLHLCLLSYKRKAEVFRPLILWEFLLRSQNRKQDSWGKDFRAALKTEPLESQINRDTKLSWELMSRLPFFLDIFLFVYFSRSSGLHQSLQVRSMSEFQGLTNALNIKYDCMFLFF